MIGLENKSERNDMLSSEFYYDFILGNPIHNFLAQCLTCRDDKIFSNLPNNLRILKLKILIIY